MELAAEYLFSLQRILDAPDMPSEHREFLAGLLEPNYQLSEGGFDEIAQLMTLRGERDDLDEDIDFCVDYIMSKMEYKDVTLDLETANICAASLDMNQVMNDIFREARIQGRVEAGLPAYDEDSDDVDDEIAETAEDNDLIVGQVGEAGHIGSK